MKSEDDEEEEEVDEEVDKSSGIGKGDNSVDKVYNLLESELVKKV